ncbi:peptidylprolyl isomerase [Nocardia sp. NPDC052566]|uniref:peptidylprolyl isomerase n=1 Tax=Nocardia sp. NPDC052566 TaxID=3364330 RepID=UPI0037C67856
MPSNEQRRAAAQRKLERQLANRAARARKRKQLTIAGSVLGVVVLVAAGVGVYFLTKGDDDKSKDAALAGSVNCTYNASRQPAAKPVNKPRTDGIKTTGGDAKLSVSMDTSAGPIGLTLNNAKAPCTVNSFASLVGQKYFDGTTCHRMTAGEGLKVLQCGDPTGTGTGGPGYTFDDEYPANQFPPGDPSAQMPIPYKRGVVAMANGGPSTNGSQFFLVYGDSQLPPAYTIFGTVDEPGLATLDKIAAAGQDNSGGQGDGKPNVPVEIKNIQID